MVQSTINVKIDAEELTEWIDTVLEKLFNDMDELVGILDEIKSEGFSWDDRYDVIIDRIKNSKTYDHY